ncbi:hypothetical protein V8C35DRAFT_312975 [Trichoderma chlorosporum]
MLRTRQGGMPWEVDHHFNSRFHGLTVMTADSDSASEGSTPSGTFFCVDERASGLVGRAAETCSCCRGRGRSQKRRATCLKM